MLGIQALEKKAYKGRHPQTRSKKLFFLNRNHLELVKKKKDGALASAPAWAQHTRESSPGGPRAFLSFADDAAMLSSQIRKSLHPKVQSRAIRGPTLEGSSGHGPFSDISDIHWT